MTGCRLAPLATTLLVLQPALAQDKLSPLEYNADALVEMAVEGVISPPTMRPNLWRVRGDGTPEVRPGVGSITYNFRTGDSAVRMAGNHVEPAVSIYNLGVDSDRKSSESRALNALSCVGNTAIVVSGDAKGERGVVIGKHGGAEHVMVDFADDDVYDKLAIGDRIMVRSIGTGIELTNAPGVLAMNIGPRLIEALEERGMGVTADGRLRVPVTHRIPAKIMGSGLGQDNVFVGDYDVQMFDEAVVAEYGLDRLRFGDIVAIENADHSYGRIYRTGAVSVGVVVHGISLSAGHGPGVATLFTSTEGRIETITDPDSNLGLLLDIREPSRPGD